MYTTHMYVTILVEPCFVPPPRYICTHIVAVLLFTAANMCVTANGGTLWRCYMRRTQVVDMHGVAVSLSNNTSARARYSPTHELASDGNVTFKPIPATLQKCSRSASDHTS